MGTLILIKIRIPGIVIFSLFCPHTIIWSEQEKLKLFFQKLMVILSGLKKQPV